MTFRPAYYAQYPDFQACMAAGGAEALDRATRGGVTHSAAYIRNFTGDHTGGLDFWQIDAALTAIDARANLDVRPKLVWATAMAMLDRGQGFMACVSYGVIVDAGYNGNQSSGFRDNHQIFINERLGGNVFKYDPLLDGRRSDIPTDPHWMPESVLKKACGAAVTIDSHGTAVHIGLGYMQGAFTRDTEPDYKVVLAGQAFFEYHPSGSPPVLPADSSWRESHAGRVFSARCTAPRYIPRAGGLPGRSLVQITSGAYSGWWVSSSLARSA